MPSETIAIIDLGTNTFHLLIVEIDERENYEIKGKFKEPVQLGQGSINAGKIGEEAFKRGIRALKTYRTIIDTSSIKKVFAFATSAIRSASNGQDFIKAAKETANIEIKTINGNEEAAIIFEGVKNGVQLPFGERVLIVDIGGGSVEFIVAYEGKAELLRSINIGGARLLDKIKPSNPIKIEEVAELNTLLDKELGGLIRELKEFDLTMLVGSSGTCESIGNLVAISQKDKVSAGNLNGFTFFHKDFEDACLRIIRTTKAERLKMDIDVMRADTIVLGIYLIHYLFKNLSLPQMMISTQALKEGILHRYLYEKQARLQKFIGPTDRSLRARAIQSLAKKFNYEEEHALKVTELAVELFNQLSAYHDLGVLEKEILQYAAILHDIGKFIHVSSHHKHGQYIIANSNLSGFTTTELLVISNIVRYHRKAGPKGDHPNYQVLSIKDRRTILILAGILRVADNLDRGHRNYVSHLFANVSETKIEIEVFAKHEIEMEIAAATENADLLSEAFGRKIEIVQKE